MDHVGKHLKNGDFDSADEKKDLDLREWLFREGFLQREPTGAWRLRVADGFQTAIIEGTYRGKTP